MSMSVCVCRYINLLWGRSHTCIHTCVHECFHACMHACMSPYIHTCTHAHQSRRRRRRCSTRTCARETWLPVSARLLILFLRGMAPLSSQHALLMPQRSRPGTRLCRHTERHLCRHTERHLCRNREARLLPYQRMLNHMPSHSLRRGAGAETRLCLNPTAKARREPPCLSRLALDRERLQLCGVFCAKPQRRGAATMNPIRARWAVLLLR